MESCCWSWWHSGTIETDRWNGKEILNYLWELRAVGAVSAVESWLEEVHNATVGEKSLTETIGVNGFCRILRQIRVYSWYWWFNFWNFFTTVSPSKFTGSNYNDPESGWLNITAWLRCWTDLLPAEIVTHHSIGATYYKKENKRKRITAFVCIG